jgi:hypothetical protein
MLLSDEAVVSEMPSATAAAEQAALLVMGYVHVPLVWIAYDVSA